MINKEVSNITRKEKFRQDYLEKAHTTGVSKLIVVVRLPSGAQEVIINDDNISEKMAYYLAAYDNDLKLKGAPMDIKIEQYLIV
jgi:hypothetical protein